MVSDKQEFDRIDALFDELFPICRSITGPGLRQSLEIISEHIPIKISSVPSGTEVFDWEVPPEWCINDAHLVGPEGETYADFQETNLSVLNYSESVDRHMSFEDLDSHLYTDPEVPDAIPYVTSYYDRRWGFCLPHNKYKDLPKGEYHAYIDSEFVDGELNYGHTMIQGETDEEVLLSSYLCHPSLANNELSGPLVLSSLYKQIKEWEEHKYTYRFVLCPETIGSLTYLSEYGNHLKEYCVGGVVLTCLGGDNDILSYKTSRQESALIDKAVENFKEFSDDEFKIRPFTPTHGSDERQYCSPGFNLPVGQMARTVYGDYDGYHNSKDDKDFMGIQPLIKSAKTIEKLLKGFEYADRYENLEPYGEPMLSKRDLYRSVNSPTTQDDSTNNIRNDDRQFLDRVLTILNYSDGKKPMIEIANSLDCSIITLIPIITILQEEELLAPVN